MVQLGVSKNFFTKKSAEWDEGLIRHNKMQMRRVFFSGIERYNHEILNKERVDDRGVYIAQQMLDPEEFELVIGYHADLLNNKMNLISEYGELVTENRTTTVYTNLLIGYNKRLKMIVIIQVDVNLETFGEVFVFQQKDILKAKYSWFTDTFQIFDKSNSAIEDVMAFLSPKNRTTFVVSAGSKEKITDELGRIILVYMRQQEEKDDFLKFFKEFAKKDKAGG